MSDLPREFRQSLAERAQVVVPEVERVTPSQDGSEKLVLRLADGARIQSVLMPDEDRLPLCLSPQLGCLQCTFCFTGTVSGP
jgi:23S rRNA (adenine2503-C2)-methyltransferase